MAIIKQFLFYCIIILIATAPLSAQQTPVQKDSIIKALTDTLAKRDKANKELTAKIDSLSKPKPAVCTGCAKDDLHGTQKFLVYAPLVLLLIMAIIFIIWIANSNFTLEDALSVAPTAKQFEEAATARAAVKKAAAATGDTPPTVPDPQPQRSVSRLLAFITGVMAIVIAVCLVSYHAYAVFAGCGGEKQFDALWKILAGLGIGVIPYGINVWNGNAKEDSTPKS